jgi:adenine-specific DNA-methyltransferase
MDELLKEQKIIFGKDEKKIPELKAYLREVTFPFRSVFNIDSRKGSNDLESVFGRRDLFKNPKSVELISYLLSFMVGKNDLILDSFGGSGTTAHAVLDMNAQDQGNRRFILVEMDSDTAKDVTAERLRRVIGGYDKGGDKAKPVEGLGGGFRFCRLGVPLFDEYGDVAQDVTFPDLAAHIFFSETGVPIPARAQSELLGVHQGRAVYLLFDAAHPGTPREAAGNVLTPDRLAKLPAPPQGFEGLPVIYAEGCTVSSDRLKAHGAVFKQIPYQVEGV